MNKFAFYVFILAAVGSEIAAMRNRAVASEQFGESVCRKKTEFFKRLSDLSIGNLAGLRILKQARDDCRECMNGCEGVPPNVDLLAIMNGIVEAAEAAFRVVDGTGTVADEALVKIYAEAPEHKLENIDLLGVLRQSHLREQ